MDKSFTIILACSAYFSISGSSFSGFAMLELYFFRLRGVKHIIPIVSLLALTYRVF
jgi:hypothetical protein